MGRLLLVSNRLPVTVHTADDGSLDLAWSAGGLATGLRGVHQRAGGLWIGWPGLALEPDDGAQAAIETELRRFQCAPVALSADEIRIFYEDVSNGVLWPVFHYHLDRLPTEIHGWDVFERVNERFADAVVSHYRPGDTIWVHDYQLCLVPGLLRERLPYAPIGFFLHIPFPSSEVFSAIPWREELLRGLLGADLIGFHLAAYLRHFVTSLRRVLGLDVEIDRVRHDGGETHLGVFPMGVDAAAWSALSECPDVLAHVAELRDGAGEQRILLGIDRLDYTKGIPRRVLAVDRLLRLHPELRGQVRLVQVTVPSRENVESYATFHRDLDELVGRINGSWATEQWVPIHNLHRSLPEEEVCALYRAADVMLVTPVRDGMNLVAKEFVAARSDEDGVLVLSEFAGAAAELAPAIHVNPYDVDEIADRIHDALTMPAAERQRRMRALRRQVAARDVSAWAEDFTQALDAAAQRRREQAGAEPASSDVGRLAAELCRADALQILLDYDGTLVPIALTPDLAAPDRDLIALLTRLSQRPRTDVHIVSGRDHRVLNAWFGTLPIGLHAEHGLWSRWPGAREWRQHRRSALDWKGRIRPILECFTNATPGTFVEEKSHSLAWHYRNATEDFVRGGDYGEFQAKELRLLLVELLGSAPLTVLAGGRVIEVRPQGVHKGAIVPLLLQRGAGTILAFGDDTTDEELFEALPREALTVHVGDGISRARFRLDDYARVRQLLASLCERPGAALAELQQVG